MFPLRELATEEPAVSSAIGVIVGIVVAVAGFFGARFFDKHDKTQEKLEEVSENLLEKHEAKLESHGNRLDVLREDLGKLKQINEAQWRKIDELRESIVKCGDRIDRLLEKRK